MACRRGHEVGRRRLLEHCHASFAVSPIDQAHYRRSLRIEVGLWPNAVAVGEFDSVTPDDVGRSCGPGTACPASGPVHGPL